MIDIIKLWPHCSPVPLWGELHVGDGLSYPDGALYHVTARAVDDGKQVTFMMRCIVPPALGDYDYGDTVILSADKNTPLPVGVTYSRGEHRDVR